LLDLTVQARGLGRYDDGGALAAAGRVDDSVLSRLLGSAYFDRRGPKSLDRYDFPLDAVEQLSDTDAAATLVAFTAESVAIGAHQLPEMPKFWIVCGGGRHNPFLMDALRQRLGRCESADTFGLRGDFIEAEAIAFAAARSALGLPLTYPETTGVPVPTSGGVRYAGHRNEAALSASR
jgi:anhydro-N-acetylmuramic acid kinase